MRDPFDILGVSPDAEWEVILAAYRALARKYHPDTGPGGDAAELNRRMTELNHAREELESDLDGWRARRTRDRPANSETVDREETRGAAAGTGTSPDREKTKGSAWEFSIARRGLAVGLGSVLLIALVATAAALIVIRLSTSESKRTPAETVRTYLEKDLYRSRERGEVNLMTEIVPAYFDPVSCAIPGVQFSEAFSPALLNDAPAFSARVDMSFAVLEDALDVDTMVERGSEAVVSIQTRTRSYRQRMIEISDGENTAWFFVCS